MKGLFAPIVYLIVLLFHFNGVQAMKLLIDLEDSQLLGPTPCNSASDCQHLESAVCVKSYCECNGTKFCPSQLENKVLKLGQLCNQSSECIIENSICEEGKCSCKQGTVEHMDGGRCLMEENSKSNSTNKCTKEGCKCDTGYVSNYASTNCLEIAEKLNSACDEDLQCIANFENSICHQSSCQCIQGYRYNANANMCIKDSSSDVRSQDETDGFASAGCVDGICKEDHDEVQLSMDAEEPCIGPLCNGFQKKQENNCTVGRCECPEERKFCTNQARPRHSSYKPMLVHQVDEEPEEDVTKAPPKQHYLHSSNSTDSDKSDWEKKVYAWQYVITISCNFYIYCLTFLTVLIIVFSPDLLRIMSPVYKFTGLAIALGNFVALLLDVLPILYRVNMTLCAVLLLIVLRYIVYWVSNLFKPRPRTVRIQQQQYQPVDQPQRHYVRPTARRRTGRRRQF